MGQARRPPPSNSDSVQRQIRSALSFLENLEAKLRRTKVVIEQSQLTEVDVLRAELRTYSHHLDQRCGPAVGEPCKELSDQLNAFLSNFTVTKLKSPGEETHLLLVDANSLLGSVRATHELVQSQKDRLVRRLVAGVVAVAGLLPAAIVGPELVTLMVAGVVGYLGISGTAWDMATSVFRGKKRRGEDQPDDVMTA
jgi:hypothetical protein